MSDDDDDKIKRVGIRGFHKSEGESTSTFFGFECGEEGGIYVELSNEQGQEDALVLYSRNKWVRGGDRFIDHVAEEACKIGIANSS